MWQVQRHLQMGKGGTLVVHRPPCCLLRFSPISTEVLWSIIPNLLQGSMGICCFCPNPSGLSGLPHLFRGILAHTLFFIHLCFQWYFSALYEWCCVPSLTFRASSSFRIHSLSASLRRSRESSVEVGMGLPGIWLFLKHELRRIQSWNSGRNLPVCPLSKGHR